MRRRVPFDIWLCMLIAALVGLGASFVYEKVIGDKEYENYIEENTAQIGGVGDASTDETTKLTSVEEINEGTYTVFFEGKTLYDYTVDTTGAFADIGYLEVVTLESGERVAIFLDKTKIVEKEEGIYLPIGKFVEYDLKNSQFWTQYQMLGQDMPDVDYGYIDFGGSTIVINQEDYQENSKMMVTVVTFIIVFVILRIIGGRLGLFASVFAIRLKKDSDN